MHNAEIADILNLLSKLMEINGENSFRAKSYSIAAFQIEKLNTPLAEMSPEEISGQKGIGASMGKKVQEILSTGALESLQELIQKIPAGVIDMLRIKGLGPKKINAIWKEMGIESIGELQYACVENRLANYKGFGQKTQDNVLAAIDFLEKQKGWFLYAQAEPVAAQTLEWLERNFPGEVTLLTGAFAQQEPVLNVLHVVTTIVPGQISLHPHPNWEMTDYEETRENNTYFRHRTGLLIRIESSALSSVYFNSIQSSSSDAFSEALHLQRVAHNAASSEAEVFSSIGMPFIPPFLRHTDELLPGIDETSLQRIIQPGDIRGIIHSHSTWSDGYNTLEEMALQAIDDGYEYLVISDHSQSAAYANGLNAERIAAQHRQIDELNDRFAPFKIFSSIESDILINGDLDYPEAVLASFDLVIASVHSALKMDPAKATERLPKAIANKYTFILGHPTGRLLLSRDGYAPDFEKITEACARHHVAIELNANPRRLDLDYRFIPDALKAGVLISINPDAHAADAFSDTKYGVLVAQKAMVTPAQNLSSFSLAQFEAYLAATRIAKGLR